MDRTLSAMMKAMVRIEHKAARRQRCRQAWLAGASVNELARQFNVSYRTVYAWIEPMRAKRRRERDARIRELRAQGVPVAAIASEMGLTKRRIYQILKAPPKPPKRFRYFW